MVCEVGGCFLLHGQVTIADFGLVPFFKALTFHVAPRLHLRYSGGPLSMWRRLFMKDF